MAILLASSATIEITPRYCASQASDWIDTELALGYHIQGKSIKFRVPRENVSLTVNDFVGMCNGIRDYIDTLPTGPLGSSAFPLQDFRFMPFESSFEIRAYGGYYFDVLHQDGMVYVEFKVALKSLGINELRGDKFGCSVIVKVRSLLEFVEVLEHELKGLRVE